VGANLLPKLLSEKTLVPNSISKERNEEKRRKRERQHTIMIGQRENRQTFRKGGEGEKRGPFSLLHLYGGTFLHDPHIFVPTPEKGRKVRGSNHIIDPWPATEVKKGGKGFLSREKDSTSKILLQIGRRGEGGKGLACSQTPLRIKIEAALCILRGEEGRGKEKVQTVLSLK